MRSLAKSFGYAISGIAYCVKSERNMRIHITLFVYALYFALRFYGFSKTELVLLILTVASVPAFEAVNTAIERLADKAVPEVCNSVKHAKDAAAGAVLISAIAAAAVGVLLFWDAETFGEIADYFIGNVFALIALLASLALSSMFIFGFRSKK